MRLRLVPLSWSGSSDSASTRYVPLDLIRSVFEYFDASSALAPVTR